MNIKGYIKQAHQRDPDIGDFGPEFERLLEGRSGTTEDAKQIWAAIADGEAHVVETLLWAQSVAKRINRDVIHKTERDAAPAALKAIGFYGVSEPYRSAKECLTSVADFDVLDDDGNWVRPKRGTAKQWLRFLRSQGHFSSTKDKTAINKINAWRKELGIDI